MGVWNYGYDGLNRLSAAMQKPITGAADYFCWSYDSFGNRTTQATSNQAFTNSSGATACTLASSASLNTNVWANYDSNNHITTDAPLPGGVAGTSTTWSGNGIYDKAGDIIADGSNQYLYDAEGRVCAVQGGAMGAIGYQYDADGTRIGKGTITSWSCDLTTNGYSVNNDFVIDQGGGQMTEMAMDKNGTMAWQHTNVTANGSLIATYDVNGLHFYLNDPLGSRRAQTDAAGVLEQTCQSSPFGDQLNCNGSTIAPTEHHFTGKERDTESGLDYFGARYYGSSMGRFMSPDDGSDQDPTNPQSWNLYSYVQNNPLTNTDPDGHTCQTNSTDGTTYDDMDGKGCDVVDKADAQRLQNGDYDATVNGGGSSSLGTVASNVGNFISGAASSTMNLVSQVGSQLSNIAQTPGGIGCMASLAGSGGMAGAAAGGGVGLVGLAGGGVGVLVTEPAGLAIGGVGGAASGLALGMTVCPGGALAMSNGGKRLGGNQRENKQANDAKQQAERETGKKFDRALDRKFHDEITGQGYGYHELVEIAKQVLQGHI